MGTWMQQVAMGWLVYRLTHSAVLLGVVGFSSQIATFFFAPFAGVLTDQWTKRSILLTTQALLMLQAFALAFLVYANLVSIPWVLGISIFAGFLSAFDVPARQSFLIEMIENREDLGNAIALNSSIFNAARLVGPSIAGILIAMSGETLCFLMNGLSYLAVIAAIGAMTITPHKKTSQNTDLLGDLREGFDYVFGFAPIRSILMLLGFISFTAMPFTVLMPVFAKEILMAGPKTLGFLIGATGLGALSGAIYLASRKKVRGLLMNITFATALFGLGLIAFSFCRNLWLSLFFLVVAGFGMMTHIIASNTILQTLVDDDKRGRVMSFFTMALMGMTPFGSLAAGFLASKIGAQATVRLGGEACLLGGLAFIIHLPKLRAMVHKVYVERGIF